VKLVIWEIITLNELFPTKFLHVVQCIYYNPYTNIVTVPAIYTCNYTKYLSKDYMNKNVSNDYVSEDWEQYVRVNNTNRRSWCTLPTQPYMTVHNYTHDEHNTVLAFPGDDYVKETTMMSKCMYRYYGGSHSLLIPATVHLLSYPTPSAIILILH